MYALVEVRRVYEKTITRGDNQGQIDVMVAVEATDDGASYKVKITALGAIIRKAYENSLNKKVLMPLRPWAMKFDDGGIMQGFSITGDGRPLPYTEAGMPPLARAAQ